MSMLGEQIKELREAAFSIQGNLGRCLYRRKDVDKMRKVSDLLFEAADTIESLQNSLNEVADKWASEKIKAEDYARENMMLKANNSSRWFELFGTPERAAQTIGHVCQFTHGGELCDRCQAYLFDSCDRTLRLGSEQKIYDTILGWLRGDAE